MKWGIIGAMPSEVEVLKQQMEDLNEIKVGRLLFWEGMAYSAGTGGCCLLLRPWARSTLPSPPR